MREACGSSAQKRSEIDPRSPSICAISSAKRSSAWSSGW